MDTIQQPTLAEINKIRNSGFRPQVVLCLLHQQKILFLYKKKHDLWQLPQGGIDNGEDLTAAFLREINEELGSSPEQLGVQDILVIGQDKVEFPTRTQQTRDLKNDQGQAIPMKGKKYFFAWTEIKPSAVVIARSEFDEGRWVSLAEALILCEKIYQSGKKRITKQALELLHQAQKL